MTATVAATGTGPAAGPAIGATERSAADTSATLRRHGETLVVVLAGDWELARTAPRFGQLVPDGAALHPDGAAPQPDGAATHADAAATEPDGAATQPDGAATEPDGTHQPPIDAVEVDAAALGTWDSSLLTFLLQAMDHCEARDLEFREGNLPEEIVHLLELVRAVPEREMDPPPPAASFPARVGSQGLAFYRALLESVAFVGALTDSFVRLSLFRFRLRWRDFWVVVQGNSSGALPIVTLIAFLVGMIISFLGAVVLRRFGAGYFVSYLVGYGMLREMAALMTGIIMAGRTGAAFAAELGSMKMTEEIDALRTLGISPVDHLLLPRVLGLGVTMPLLTIYAGFVGILGRSSRSPAE